MQNLNLCREENEEYYLSLLKQKYENDKKYIYENKEYEIDDLFYFITVSYEKCTIRKNNPPQNFLKSINTEFSNIHKNICDVIIPGNYYRNQFLQPFCIVFIDVSGTRYNHDKNESRIIDNPHHHGILLLHPNTKKKWDEINLPEYWKAVSRKSKLVSQIHIEKLNDFEDVNRTLNYSAKYAYRHINNIHFGHQLELMCPDIPEKKLSKMIFGSSEFSKSENKEVLYV